MPRLEAFVKRILQVSLVGSDAFAGAMLSFLLELFANRPELRQMLVGADLSREAGGDEGEEQEAYDAKKRDPKYAQA